MFSARVSQGLDLLTLMLPLFLTACPLGLDTGDTSAGEGEGDDDDVRIDYHRDADGDAYGDPDDVFVSHYPPTGYIARSGDCDDGDANVHPGAAEVPYDGVDQNCTSGDEYDGDLDGHDSDAYGGDDCDDADATTYPGASEPDDGVDHDCDGLATEASEPDTGDDASDDTGDDTGDDAGDDTGDDDGIDRAWFIDADGDGYGDWTVEYYSVVAELQPDGYVDNRWDCDDARDIVNVFATEDCSDGLDNDCDGLMDCEDDDCEGDSVCVETACDDLVDEDSDGDRDCADEDCWGTSACLSTRTVSTRVSAGDWRGRRRAQSVWQDCGAYTAFPYTYDTVNSWVNSTFVEIVVYDLRGTVVVKDDDGTSTCDWGVGRLKGKTLTRKATMSHERMVYPFSGSSTRSGFWIGDGCDLSSAEFLPRFDTQSGSYFVASSRAWLGAPRRRDTFSGGTKYTDWRDDPKRDGAGFACSGLWISDFGRASSLLTSGGDTFTVVLGD